MLRVLYISDLYPCAIRPLAGSFHLPVFERLSNRCEIKVIMPVMTSLLQPTKANRLLSASTDSRVVARPRSYYLPGVRGWNGRLLATALKRPLAKLLTAWRPNVVLSSFLYPAAYGTLLQTERNNLPLVADAIGSDVNVIMNSTVCRAQVLRVAFDSCAIVTRSQAIRNQLHAAGVPAEKMTVLYNGVDQSLFDIRDRTQCCVQLGLDPDRRRILFAGLFTPIKNTGTLVDAFERVRAILPNVDLILAGNGPLRGKLAKRIRTLGLESAVSFTDGFLPHDDIPLWLNAVDVLCLPSLNEGVPNVILEALACGLPVVAGRVGGIPEVVSDDTGALVPEPTNVTALAQTLQAVLKRSWNRTAIRKTAIQFTWDAAAETMFRVLSHAASS